MLTTPDNIRFAWYAIQVKTRLEALTTSMLEHKGYEVFLPMHLSKRRWSDRIKTLHLPLFPGYTFCRFDALQRLPILTTLGVLSIVGSREGPLAVDDQEIEAIQKVVRSGVVAQPWPFLDQGQTVYIEVGPLAGLEGIVVRVNNRERIVVSVRLLNRSIAAEIDRQSIGSVGRQWRPTSLAAPVKPCP